MIRRNKPTLFQTILFVDTYAQYAKCAQTACQQKRNLDRKWNFRDELHQSFFKLWQFEPTGNLYAGNVYNDHVGMKAVRLISGSGKCVETRSVKLTVHDDFVLIVYEVKSPGLTLQNYGQ